MRFTFIPADRIVIVDGVARHLPDITAPDGIHAVQWYGEAGEVEFSTTAKGEKPPNERITSVADWRYALEAWKAWTPPPDPPYSPPPPLTGPSLDAVVRALGVVAQRTGMTRGEAEALLRPRAEDRESEDRTPEKRTPEERGARENP